jgi:ABC-type cobalt transport system substrate-binding protein
MNVDWSWIFGDGGIAWLSGGIIGYIIGYIRGARRMDSVNRNERGEAGIMRFPIIADIMLGVCVAATLYAAWVSSNAADDSGKAIDAIQSNNATRDLENQCTVAFNTTTGRALEDRTKFTTAQARANIELQKSQLPLVQAIFNPPKTEAEGFKVARDYLNALEHFVKIANKNIVTVHNNPFPTVASYRQCLRDARLGVPTEGDAQ